MNKLTQKDIEKLTYNPETGDVIWNVDSGRWGNIKSGSLAGSLRKDGRRVIRLSKDVLIYSYHIPFILEGGIPEGYEVDHIDGNPGNDKRSNLRLVTSTQNKYNMRIPKNNTSGFKGVHWNAPTNSWRVRLRINGEHTHFGLFDNLEDAVKVSLEVREWAHKEHARHR